MLLTEVPDTGLLGDLLWADADKVHVVIWTSTVSPTIKAASPVAKKPEWPKCRPRTLVSWTISIPICLLTHVWTDTLLDEHLSFESGFLGEGLLVGKSLTDFSTASAVRSGTSMKFIAVSVSNRFDGVDFAVAVCDEKSEI